MNQNHPLANRRVLAGFAGVATAATAAAALIGGTAGSAVGQTTPQAPFQRALSSPPVVPPAGIQGLARAVAAPAGSATAGIHRVALAGGSKDASVYVREEGSDLCMYTALGEATGRTCWPVVELAKTPTRPLLASIGYDDKRVVFVVAPDSASAVTVAGSEEALSADGAVAVEGRNQAVKVTTYAGKESLTTWTLGA
jgi:hypothetical protein